MQVTQRFHAISAPTLETIRGEVSDGISRYGVQLNWNGARLEGRLGGWWFPEKTSLERSPHGLIGYVASRSVHLTINVALLNHRLELLIACHGCTEVLQLGLSDGSIGIWHGRDGEQTPIYFEQTATGCTVRADQRRVTLIAPSSPDWVVASAGLVSLAAQRAVSVAMLESLRALREQ